MVFESTVWPGVTEEVCVPVLERASGPAAGVDFHVGYSPERLNPGDPTHGIDRVTKVVAGQTPAVPKRSPPSMARSAGAGCSSRATSAPRRPPR